MEVADDDVVAAREENERKKKEKGPVVKKRAAAELDGGKRKRKKQQADEVVVSSEDKTVDASPLNQVAPGAGGEVEKPTEEREVVNVESTLEKVAKTVEKRNDDLAEGSGPRDKEDPNHTQRTHSPGITSSYFDILYLRFV